MTGDVWIGLEQNITDTADNEWRKRLCAILCSFNGPTFSV